MNNIDISIGRLISLDAFRGFTIAAMILVNNPGNYKEEYEQLGHATWHGITFADFIFPFFLFIVGVSIVLSFSKQLSKEVKLPVIFKKILKRSLILFALGLLVNLLVNPTLDGGFRIAGVLQRIAIVFFVCSFLFLKTNWKTQITIGLSILFGYWVILTFIPIPDLGYPSLDIENNLISWFDRLALPGKLFDGSHDPEGILSTLPSIVTGISGLLVGQIIKSDQNPNKVVARIFVFGFVIFLIGGLWSLFFPLNKNLWTSSFVLFTSGVAAMIFALSIWIIDLKGFKKILFPFVVFGSNAILVYILSFILLYVVWPPIFGEGKAIIQVFHQFFVKTGFTPKFASLVWAVFYTFLCYIPIYFLYKRKIFIKV